MNDENKEMDTEIPIKVSEKERAIVLEALEQVKRGEVKTHEEVKKHIQQLIKELDEDRPLSKSHLITNKEHRVRAVNEL